SRSAIRSLSFRYCAGVSQTLLGSRPSPSFSLQMTTMALAGRFSLSRPRTVGGLVFLVCSLGFLVGLGSGPSAPPSRAVAKSAPRTTNPRFAHRARESGAEPRAGLGASAMVVVSRDSPGYETPYYNADARNSRHRWTGLPGRLDRLSRPFRLCQR